MLDARRMISCAGMVFLLVTSLFSFSSATIHNISIVDFAFVPQVDTIYQGDTVQWTNNSVSTPHTSTSDVGVWNSGTLSPGQSFSFPFNSAGTFPYHCAIHTSMHGTIIVYRTASVFTPWILVAFVLVLLGSGIWLMRRRRVSVAA
jgi:plastocyanin